MVDGVCPRADWTPYEIFVILRNVEHTNFTKQLLLNGTFREVLFPIRISVRKAHLIVSVLHVFYFFFKVPLASLGGNVFRTNMATIDNCLRV